MSRLQRFFTRILPSSWTAAMEESSRQWMVRCPSCGFERSIWDLGGIRWKYTGRSWTWDRCPNCGKRGWHTIYRREPDG